MGMPQRREYLGALENVAIAVRGARAAVLARPCLRIRLSVSLGVQTELPIDAQKGSPFQYGAMVEERAQRKAS